jgi:hypothetical protein
MVLRFNFIAVRLPVAARSQEYNKSKEAETCVVILHFTIELCNEFTNKHFIGD